MTSKINVRLITRSTLTRPLARLLRGWFICQIEIVENKANLAISVLLCKKWKNWSKLINCALWWNKDYFSLLYLCKIKSKLKLAKNWHHHRKHRSPKGNEERELVVPLILLRYYTRFYGSDLWPFIRGVTSLYNALQRFIKYNKCSRGSWMLLIRPKRTEFLPICSSTCIKQWTKNSKSCPKTLWKCLGLLVKNLQNLTK